ncbi:MAG: carboxypeptidase regulatory-like domain-containing protein, partial [candidate division KSB1 bacterium]|nr:carboxypeptidase regulatory-like domain-containing protein [candidate division KSB1 bacterium]
MTIRISRISCLVLLSLLAHQPLLGADPVSIVRYPLLGRPVITVPGGRFTIECVTSASTSGWQAWLSMPYAEFPLSLTVGEYAKGVRTLVASVPAQAPFELYDLRVTAGGVTDVVSRCVRVIPAFRDTFTFVHIPDCHIPSVSWIGFYDDENTVPELAQIIDELGFLNPAFVLQTGDLVDNGQIDEHFRTAQTLLATSQVPVFVTGGNHDLWYNGHDLWHRYFGPVMDYTFLYGSVRFVGMEMYDIPTPTFTAAQMAWLRETLEQSVSNRERARILFTHYDQSAQLTADFVDQYLVDAVIYGHTHVNNVRRIGARGTWMLNTSFTMNDNGEYRLVKVRDGALVDYPVMKFRRLWVNTFPAQDGSSWKAGAYIRNDNDVDLEDVLVKLHVRRSAGPFTVQGGTVLQALDYGEDKRVYYVRADVPRQSQRTITVQGQSTGNEPPVIASYWPRFDTTAAAGQTVLLRVQVVDESPGALQYAWQTNGTPVAGANGPACNVALPVDSRGVFNVEVEVTDGALRDRHTWRIYVAPPVNRPTLTSSTRSFFPYDREVELTWREPFAGSAVFEYGRSPGVYTGSLPEEGTTNRVRFVPRDVGMGLGLYFCRIRLGALSSDEFTLVVEAPRAPTLVAPLGPVKTVSPTFQWQPVEGVPYYLVIMTDQRIRIVQDPVTGEYSIEGANPVWAVLTPECSVPYGAPDPSGTFTSVAPPLAPGGEYWWVVLNCYGPTPELSSTVQSGVGSFRVDMPAPNVRAPTLLAPPDKATLAGANILFRWEAVPNAVAYHFYPFKVELEAGVEVVRPIWETVIATTNTALDFPAGRSLVKGNYLWKVAAVGANGVEVSSSARAFSYEAPSATVNLRTWDDRATPQRDDDIPLPRVTVSYEAIEGVDLGLPLATDTEGKRTGITFAPGVYVLEARREGYAPTRDTLSVLSGRTYEVNLNLRPEPSSVRGSVKDQTGQPVAAATVRATHSLRPDLVRETTSNQLGDFSLALPPGSWRVQATKAGFRPSSEVAVETKAGETTQLPAALRITRNQNSLSGTVVNDGGVAVYGATVVATLGADRMQATTDATGRFAFTLYDGYWTIQASKAGFVSSPARGMSLSGGVAYELTPPLVLTPMAALVAGIVNSGLAPLAEAEVRAIPLAGSVQTVTTDGYGRFTLSLSPGTYTLEPRKEGFSPAGSQVLSLSSGETVSGIELLLTPHDGSISGSVSTDGTLPLAGATVTANGRTTLSDAAGRYSLAVAPGAHSVVARKEGYLDPQPVTVTVGPGQSVQGVNFVLPPNASVIKGRVLYSSGVAGAVVGATGPSQKSTVSDDNGNYALGVEPGTWTLTAYKTGFSSETVTVQVGQAQVLEGRDIRLKRSVAVLQGVVIEASTREAVPSASVTVEPGSVATTTRVDGSFKFELDPQPGGVTVTVTKPGFAPLSRICGPLAAGSTTNIECALAKLGTRLVGVVTDEAGDRLEGARVLAVAGTDTFAVLSSQGGSFLLPLPRPGTFAVSADKPGYAWRGAALVVTLSEGQEKSLELQLARNFAGLRGRTLDARDGAPLANVSLAVRRGGHTAASCTSDQTGEYQFADDKGRPFLVQGTYELWAGKQGFADTLLVGLQLRGGSTLAQDVHLRRHEAWLEGVVSNGATPLANAMVTAQRTDGAVQYTTVTRSNGSFRLAPIASGDYRLRAQLAGYTWPRDTVVRAPQSNVFLRLVANEGRIWGTVLDAEAGQGLSGVSIFASDGQGNEARTSSLSDGRYELASLPVFQPYRLTASKWGYRTASRT